MPQNYLPVPLPPRLSFLAPTPCQCPARPPKGRELARAPEKFPPRVLARPGARDVGTCLPSASPHQAKRRGVKAPAALAGPRTPVACPRSPVPAPHDLVLVRDELVYIFQIKLVRHGAAELKAPPQQLQLPPAGNVFPLSRVRGRFPQQQRRRTTAAARGSN